MATLLELKKIYDDTFLDPGDPADAAIVAAHDLLGKFEVAVWRRCHWYLDEARDDTPGKVMVGWSSRASNDSATMSRTMLKLLLGSLQAKTSTVAQIFARTDDQIEAAVDKLIPLFAEGVLVSR